MLDKLQELGNVIGMTPEQVLRQCAMTKFTNFDEVAVRWQDVYYQHGYTGLNTFVKTYCDNTLAVVRASQEPAHA